MRGSDERTGSLFSFVDLEERVPKRHPLRKIRQIVNDALSALDADFSKLYASEGRPSIAPEKLLRASLLQAFFSVRSERQLMEQINFNLLFRWFVGPGHRRCGVGRDRVHEEPQPAPGCRRSGEVHGGRARAS
jgi:transposase